MRRTKVYQYGSPLKTQRLNEGYVLEQLRLQNQFWNALVELEREFKERYNKIVVESDDRTKSLNSYLDGLDARILELRQNIKSKRKAARSGKVPDDGTRKEIAALIDERKLVYEELKEYRAEANINNKPQFHDLDVEFKSRRKSLRQQYSDKGLYWGNYNAVWESFMTARSKAMKEGAQLRFHRFDVSGRWTCQIQGGMTVANAFALTDNRFQIDPVPPEAWTHHSRAERRRLSRTTARIRIGSREDRGPIWHEVPIVMHRPIPEVASIKSVAITAKKVGNRINWFLNVTVTTNGALTVERTGKVIAIDVGWRKKVGGLRVGYWVDSDDKEDEILLDESFLETESRLEGLQQTLDNNFNVAKEKLRRWLAAQTEVPTWLLEAVEHLPQWRARRKLASVVSHWRDNRFDGDHEILEWLEKWRKQDKHLWTWQSNLRGKQAGRRLDQYRVLAGQLAKNYDVIVIEDFDLRQVKTKKRPEEGVDTDSKIRNAAKVASVGILRSEIKRACIEAGKLFAKVDPFNTTLECPFCGGRIEGSPRPSITVTCGNCHAVYDQDWAGAINILKKFSQQGPEAAIEQTSNLKASSRFRRQSAAHQG
ncbi:MAG: zinc ribbon domain-containing protein [Desulfuromonadaceae bacterium]